MKNANTNQPNAYNFPQDNDNNNMNIWSNGKCNEKYNYAIQPTADDFSKEHRNKIILFTPIPFA